MFDQLQYRMAEVVFRPFKVLRSCWVRGRQGTRKYTLAAWMVFLPTLGFGLWLGNTLKGPIFSFDAAPSFSGYIGLLLTILWFCFTFYIFVLLMVIGLIRYIRK